MKRLSAIAIAAAAAAGGTALAVGPAAAPAPAASPSSRADVVFEGVRLWVFQGSRLRSVGSASQVTYERAAGVGQAARPDADFLSVGPASQPVHVTAGTAEGHVNGRTLDARDGVFARRADGTAQTASAHYDGLKRVASGSQPIDVQTARFQVRGEGGFHLDVASQQLELDGPVTAQGEVQP